MIRKIIHIDEEKCNGHYGREQYGHNDGHGELAVELSGDTSQEADRDEYRSQYQ